MRGDTQGGDRIAALEEGSQAREAGRRQVEDGVIVGHRAKADRVVTHGKTAHSHPQILIQPASEIRDGVTIPVVDQWDRGPRTLVMALLAVIVVLVAAYWLAFPVVVRAVAVRVPQGALETIGVQVLASLDHELLQPSALPAAHQNELTEAFGRLSQEPALVGRARLVFRKSDALGANALALPSGVVIVTDGLVELAKDSDDVTAVLAHEVGHLAGRHGVRAVIQSALVSGLIALVVGDVSGLAAAAPAALLNARYSRDLEREADAYAVTTLRAVGIAPTRLADMLERMETQRSNAGQDGPAGVVAYLSTHPTTEERLRTLRE